MYASLLLSLVPLPELLALEVVQEALPKVVAEGAEEEVVTGRAGLARSVRRLSSSPRWCRVHATSEDPPVSLPSSETGRPEELVEGLAEVRVEAGKVWRL